MKLHHAVRFLTFGLLLLVIPAALPSPSSAQVFVSVRIGPPALPIYAQPLCPGPGYLWTPGYWAWNDEGGYYWVPGTWVVAPIGMLWTPGYWGWGGGFYAWHPGYWGPHIGFYGGINYGFGYGGVGFFGGEWRGGAFFYNRAVVNVSSVHITNVYENRTVVVNNESHVAFNGGEGGVAARATAAEESAAREPHQAALATQTQHEHAAAQNKALFASNNHGAPAVAATARPGEFSGKGVVAAKAGAEYHAPAVSPKEARVPASEANRSNNTPGGAKAESHPFTPPANTGKGKMGNAQTNPMYKENQNSGTNPMYENNKDKTASAPKSTTSESHSASAPKSKPAKQPKHQAPPPKEEKRGKGR
jgi:hypothetical protein